MVFRYEDGSSATNQLLYGDDSLDWIANTKPGQTFRGPKGSNSKLAWLGEAFTPDKNRRLCFCLTAIKNPQPWLEVTSMDLYSCKSKSAACIMAMTAGRAGLLR